MSQKIVKRERKEYRKLFEGVFERIAQEPLKVRMKMAWSVLTKTNYFLDKVNRRK
jgi:hypothetical protein